MSKIKVIWFSNTPANGLEYLGLNTAGSGTWLQSLNIAIESKVELTIVFHYKENIRFKHNDTLYIGLRRFESTAGELFFRFRERFTNHVLDDDCLSNYLTIINELRPDIIHIHGTENHFGCIASSTNVPTVTSIQGNLTIWEKKFTGSINQKYLRVRNFSLKSIKNFLFPTNFANAKKKFAKMSKVERKNMLLCQSFIGRTDWDRRICSVMSPKSRYFHNDEIIRSEFFKFNWRKNVNINNVIALHTTTDNVMYKGFEVICETINILKSSGNSVIWNIAGLSAEDLIVKITRKIMGSNFPGNSIIFHGRLNTKELIDSILNSDIYVMPSHIENSPNSLAEAMILGIPCIASFVGGTGSFIENKKSGLLIQSGDPWCLAGSIIELANNATEAEQLGSLGKLSARRRHDPIKIVEELQDIYRQLLDPSVHTPRPRDTLQKPDIL
jgi:glycosyltransferase involved in cell wall biosynthesis